MDIADYRTIIGHGVPVFDSGDVVAFRPTRAMYIDGKQACIGNRSSIISGTTTCKTLYDGVGGLVRFGVFNTGGTLIGYTDRTYSDTLTLLTGSEVQSFV